MKITKKKRPAANRDGWINIDDCIWQHEGDRRYKVIVTVGSGEDRLKSDARYCAPDADLDEVRLEREKERLALKKQVKRGAVAFSLAADVKTYIKSADISPDNRVRRQQQFDWWCAQSAALGADVLSPAQVIQEAEAFEQGKPIPPRGTLLGDLSRRKLDMRRIREILAQAFSPTDPATDPYEFASNSNSYRTALVHLYNVLDQDDAEALNPLSKVKSRPQRGALPKGIDFRVVKLILDKYFFARSGPKSKVSKLRIDVLAWVHIEPQQLKGVVPSRDFHDVPNATLDDMINGMITLTKRPRLKGQRGRPLPPPETIPLNPWGVYAMRAFAANPAAQGGADWVASLNRMFKRACARTQAELAKQGVTVDLSKACVKHLRHSLATTATLASHGLVNLKGQVQQHAGVSRSLDHSKLQTTSIYTQAAVNPMIREVNRLTSLYLLAHEHDPLVPTTPLTLVKRDGTRDE